MKENLSWCRMFYTESDARAILVLKSDHPFSESDKHLFGGPLYLSSVPLEDLNTYAELWSNLRNSLDPGNDVGRALILIMDQLEKDAGIDRDWGGRVDAAKAINSIREADELPNEDHIFKNDRPAHGGSETINDDYVIINNDYVFPGKAR